MIGEVMVTERLVRDEKERSSMKQTIESLGLV